MNKHLAKLTSKPRAVFLMDGSGAILSAILLSVIAKFNTVVGMPQNTLLVLVAIACVFATYSLSCYFFAGKNWRPFLTGIAAANTLYSILTISLLFYHQQQITVPGLVYFVNEVIVLGVLVFIEVRTVKTI